MACQYSPGPLCDWCEYCNILERPGHHHLPFKPISVSPVTGITFEAFEYSANQLADGFESIIQGHMDSEIKRSALARWNELLPDLLDGSVCRDAEFDLKDLFHILDDFLFMGALQHLCRVDWVDESQKGHKRKWVGWCELAVPTNRGPRCVMSIVRPTVKKPRTIEDVVATLKHEMCHALFAFRCRCYCCRCPLNRIKSEGLSGHGPSWQKIRRCVERTANLYLDDTFESSSLCHHTEPELKNEEKKVAKMLNGFYKKVTQQGSESAQLKEVERAKRKEEAEMVAEFKVEPDGEEKLDILACAGAMFKAFESLTIS